MTLAQTEPAVVTHPLTGESALVTGAGRGIERAVALELAKAGARVAILSRTEHELDEVAVGVDRLGGVGLVLVTDIGDPRQVAKAADRVLAEFGSVDVLINNAAVVWPLGSTISTDPAEWAQAIGVNVMGPVTLTCALLPGMLAGGWGRIVNVSGGIASHPAAMIGGNAYASSKAALEAHTLNLAAELAGTGVTVNAFRPGSVDTAMQAWIRSQPPSKIGAALHERFTQAYERRCLITPGQSARSLLDHLTMGGTGEVWTVTGSGA